MFEALFCLCLGHCHHQMTSFQKICGRREFVPTEFAKPKWECGKVHLSVSSMSAPLSRSKSIRAVVPCFATFTRWGQPSLTSLIAYKQIITSLQRIFLFANETFGWTGWLLHLPPPLRRPAWPLPPLGLCPTHCCTSTLRLHLSFKVQFLLSRQLSTECHQTSDAGSERMADPLFSFHFADVTQFLWKDFFWDPPRCFTSFTVICHQ